MRILITGAPRTGKTTLANSMGANRSTDEVMDLGWSEASLEVSTWFDAPAYIIEGVAIPRALRKWKANNPNQSPPVDKIIILTEPFEALNDGQMRMGKGMDTVWREIEPWLDGVEVEYR